MNVLIMTLSCTVLHAFLLTVPKCFRGKIGQLCPRKQRNINPTKITRYIYIIVRYCLGGIYGNYKPKGLL